MEAIQNITPQEAFKSLDTFIETIYDIKPYTRGTTEGEITVDFDGVPYEIPATFGSTALQFWDVSPEDRRIVHSRFLKIDLEDNVQISTIEDYLQLSRFKRSLEGISILDLYFRKKVHIIYTDAGGLVPTNESHNILHCEQGIDDCLALDGMIDQFISFELDEYEFGYMPLPANYSMTEETEETHNLRKLIRVRLLWKLNFIPDTHSLRTHYFEAAYRSNEPEVVVNQILREYKSSKLLEVLRLHVQDHVPLSMKPLFNASIPFTTIMDRCDKIFSIERVEHVKQRYLTSLDTDRINALYKSVRSSGELYDTCLSNLRNCRSVFSFSSKMLKSENLINLLAFPYIQTVKQIIEEKKHATDITTFTIINKSITFDDFCRDGEKVHNDVNHIMRYINGLIRDIEKIQSSWNEDMDQKNETPEKFTSSEDSFIPCDKEYGQTDSLAILAELYVNNTIDDCDFRLACLLLSYGELVKVNDALIIELTELEISTFRKMKYPGLWKSVEDGIERKQIVFQPILYTRGKLVLPAWKEQSTWLRGVKSIQHHLRRPKETESNSHRTEKANEYLDSYAPREKEKNNNSGKKGSSSVDDESNSDVKASSVSKCEPSHKSTEQVSNEQSQILPWQNQVVFSRLLIDNRAKLSMPDKLSTQYMSALGNWQLLDDPDASNNQHYTTFRSFKLSGEPVLSRTNEDQNLVLLDSGLDSVHVCGNKDLFIPNSLHTADEPDIVTYGYSASESASVYGDILLGTGHFQIKLKNVLFIPGVTGLIVSLPTLINPDSEDNISSYDLSNEYDSLIKAMILSRSLS